MVTGLRAQGIVGKRKGMQWAHGRGAERSRLGRSVANLLEVALLRLEEPLWPRMRPASLTTLYILLLAHSQS